LGDLAAGSSPTQLENLIGKWYLGSDHPIAYGTYQNVSGSLFQNGISYQDIHQGAVGDCYFVAALAETALRSPSAIQNMFIDNGDGTFTVRFYNGATPQYVTVDTALPTSSWGTAMYASFGGSYDSTSNELWVALAEKAYAQIDECGWTRQDGNNSYDGIAGGWPSDVLQQVNGSGSSTSFSFSHNDVVSAFNSGRLVCLDTVWSPTNSQVVGNHAYAMVGYDAGTDTFSLFNPWGLDNGHDSGVIQLSWSDIATDYDAFDSTSNMLATPATDGPNQPASIASRFSGGDRTNVNSLFSNDLIMPDTATAIGHDGVLVA
jgi:hypothetical protein